MDAPPPTASVVFPDLYWSQPPSTSATSTPGPLTQPTSPSTTPNTTAPGPEVVTIGPTTATIVGAAVGSVLGVLAILLVAFLLGHCRHRQRRQRARAAAARLEITDKPQLHSDSMDPARLYIMQETVTGKDMIAGRAELAVPMPELAAEREAAELDGKRNNGLSK
ncbi:uncharacterized protein B0I36DRAFT_369111 [Microdochium trichocladiopsis]|uniref:Uncharacterized protein n=1 Tax=Microdochium trichocladiopsis TaxID=1682393 RepID=A0A9P9BLI2_9PEZI|nr:uncharacterized protein B0I36DRAFT_369111 [Microdochium trichocladiopsis]KAH7014117.1 hypothetical protein B0I36DRAFT_369111 [Microdochium trichocladiopsis]